MTASRGEVLAEQKGEVKAGMTHHDALLQPLARLLDAPAPRFCKACSVAAAAHQPNLVGGACGHATRSLMLSSRWPTHALVGRWFSNSRVTPLLKQLQCEGVLGVDHPQKQEASLGLQLRHRQLADVLVTQLAVAKRHTTSGVGSSKLPRRVHHDDIKRCYIVQCGPVKGCDIGVDGDAVRWDLPF